MLNTFLLSLHPEIKYFFNLTHMKYLPLVLLLVAQTSLLKAEETALKFEAEDGSMSKSEIVSDAKYSGGKAVKMTDAAASLTINAEITEGKKYSIFIMAEGIGGEKIVNCSVNGAVTSFKTNNYGEVEIGTFILETGENSITITPNWTWFNIDYIRLEEYGQGLTFDISSVPVTPDASESAQKLYTFLYENFGKRTISGMMTGSMDNTDGKDVCLHEDIKAVFDVSGYNPALVGFDFMNATGKDVDAGNNWFIGYTQKIIGLAKDVWKNGGIPDFSWHWRDPSRKAGEFYSEKATFKFTDAMNADGSWNTSSTLYKNLIKDIDIIADYFLDLQNEGVACIFRPLHEAPGGWFWWGTQGAEAYAKLFRLVFDEMVKVKGVKNVIWDWNADYTLTDSWCPGAEYYDVISTDIYNKPFDYSSNYPAFDKLKALSGGKKLITLAENGPIPDIDKQEKEEAMWSWWMPWYQSWDGKFVNQTSKEEWQKCMSNERIITLDRMPGWDAESSISAIEAINPKVEYCYDLNGTRSNDIKKGKIRLINGRKIILFDL